MRRQHRLSQSASDRADYDPARFRRDWAIAGDFLLQGRVGRPSNIAAYTLFLTSEESAWVTGTHLYIDRGNAVI